MTHRKDHDQPTRDPQDQAFGQAAAEDQAAADDLDSASSGEATAAAGDEPLRDPAPRAAGKADPA